jgi:hypothetical protein
VSKSDLQARPITTASATPSRPTSPVVFAALDASRWIDDRTGWLIREFGKTARRYRTVEIRAGRQAIIAADPLPATSAKPSKPS